MSIRTVKPGPDERLDSFRPYDHTPANTAHHGRCACGESTTRSVQGIGWQCRTCGEAAIQAQFDRQARKPKDGR